MNDTDPLIGRIIDGRYEILRRVARGGMATVYVATDNRLTRTVAIKIMHEGLGEDKDFVDRFDREARASAKLSHPNIVSVFDQGHDNGRPYIVMEYIEGCTLRNLISREAPMPASRALALMESVASALAAAHESGLIHRDVKPENVLISERNLIKVADFGLAKAVTAQSSTAAQGLVMGTVSYIAPEVVTSGKADTRSDIYSFGIMLYEMLTGTKPHSGDSPIQVAYSHVHNDIPLPSQSQYRNGAIFDYLDALVTTAAARDPKQRPRDARVLLEHVKIAKDAIAKGIGNDPGLVAHMKRTTPLSKGDTLPLPKNIDSENSSEEAATLIWSNKTQALDSVKSDIPLSVKTTKKKTGKHFRRRLLLTLVTLLLIASLVWYFFIWRYQATPDLIGKSKEEAEKILTVAKLSGEFGEEYSEDIASGNVTRTEPGAGQRVLKEGRVKVWISKGPERYTVPDLVGKIESEAAKLLTDNNLTIGEKVFSYDDKVPAGQIISFEPKANSSVKRDTAIKLNISKGPEPVKIPDFTGNNFKESEKELQKMGLKIDSQEENSDTVKAGDIISQDPKDYDGHRGDTVKIVISKGPVMVTVPNVRMISPEDAKQRLQQAGFKVEVIQSAKYGFNLVHAQSPAAGTTAPKGSTVTIRYA